MSDDVKDFAYYAVKAEETLARLPELPSADGKRLCVAKADVYARLACGAPKSPAFVDPEPCGSFHGIDSGDSKSHITLNTPARCRYKHGHTGTHQCMCCMYQW